MEADIRMSARAYIAARRDCVILFTTLTLQHKLRACSLNSSPGICFAFVFACGLATWMLPIMSLHSNRPYQ